MINPLLIYPLITVGIAGIVFIAVRYYGTELDTPFPHSRQETKAFLIGSLIFSSFLTIIYNASSLYYVILTFIGLTAVFTIAAARYRPIVVIIPIFITTLLSRGLVWRDAPLQGHDPRLHLGITKYMVRTGEIIPESFWYYTWYPTSHTLATELTLLTGLDTNQGYFLMYIAAVLVSLLFVYMFTNRITVTDSNLPALLAILTIIVSAWHYNRTALPFSQVLGSIYVFILVYVISHSNSKRWVGAGFVILTCAILTHNTVPIVLLLLLGLYLFSSNALRYIDRFEFVTVGTRRIGNLKGIVVVVFILVSLISSVQIWQNTQEGLFEIQVLRVMGILLPGSGVSTEVGGSQFAQQAISIVGIQIPVLLLFAIPLLVSGFYVTIAMFDTITSIFHNHPKISQEWTVAICLYFGIIGIAFAAGAQSNVSRFFDITMLLLGPVAGFVGYKLYSAGRLGVIILVILIVINPAVSVIGIQHGLPITFVPPTEKQPPAYPSYQTESEITAITHGSQYFDSVHTDNYTAGSATSLRWGQAREHRIVKGYLEPQYLTTRTFHNFSRDTNDSAFLFRTMYKNYSGATVPPCYSTVYHSGDGKIVKSC